MNEPSIVSVNLHGEVAVQRTVDMYVELTIVWIWIDHHCIVDEPDDSFRTILHCDLSSLSSCTTRRASVAVAEHVCAYRCRCRYEIVTRYSDSTPYTTCRCCRKLDHWIACTNCV